MDNHQYADFLAKRVIDDAKDLENAAAVLRSVMRDRGTGALDEALAVVIARAESAISQAKDAVRRRKMERT